MSESAVLRFRILGCGSSGGVPRINGDWGDCDPKNKKNRRLRCSLLVERANKISDLHTGQTTKLLIDTSPDLREQILAAETQDIDAVAYTHTHADQCHGIDDLRAIVYTQGERLKAFMDRDSEEELLQRFSYIFQTPKGSLYPPLLDKHVFERPGQFQVTGKGGTIKVKAFPVEHGRLTISGFRMGPLAYTPDISDMPDCARRALQNCPLWIVDALREKPHPTHAHLDQSLSWITQLGVKHAVLTNLHIDMDYDILTRKCPSNVQPAFDGLSLVLDENSGEVLDMS